MWGVGKKEEGGRENQSIEKEETSATQQNIKLKFFTFFFIKYENYEREDRLKKSEKIFKGLNHQYLNIKYKVNIQKWSQDS